MASQLASTQAIAMSSFRREHVSPSEFTALVQSYYKAREPYDKLFKQYLDSQNKMPHHDAEESTHGGECKLARGRSGSRAPRTDTNVYRRLDRQGRQGVHGLHRQQSRKSRRGPQPRDQRRFVRQGDVAGPQEHPCML